MALVLARIIDGVSPMMQKVLIESCNRNGNRLDTQDQRRFRNDKLYPERESNFVEDSKKLDMILRRLVYKSTKQIAKEHIKKTASSQGTDDI